MQTPVQKKKPTERYQIPNNTKTIHFLKFEVILQKVATLWSDKIYITANC